MADSQIIPTAPIPRPYDDSESEYEEENSCVCAQDTCDECNPGESEKVERPPKIFTDNIKSNQLNHCHDTIQACWNAWDTACKYQDSEQAAYYLDLLTLTQQYQKKLLKLKKKN